VERADPVDAGVVHEDVEQAEARRRRVEKALEGLAVRDVELHAERPGRERFGGGLGGTAVDVADRDPRSSADELVGDRATDAVRAAGDGDGQAGQRDRGAHRRRRLPLCR
jgi:hypothetical protein